MDTYPDSLSSAENLPIDNLFGILQETGFDNYNAEDRLRLIESADLEDFKSVLDKFHSLLAPETEPTESSLRAKLIDPRTGETTGYLVEPEDRDKILNHALTNAKKLIDGYRNGGGSIDDVLRRCANLAGLSIVLAHRYEDGNGRTARAVSELVARGFNPNDSELVDDLRVLGSNRPDSGRRINSFVPINEWVDRSRQSPEDFLDLVAGFGIPFDGTSYDVASRSLFTRPRTIN